MKFFHKLNKVHCFFWYLLYAKHICNVFRTQHTTPYRQVLLLTQTGLIYNWLRRSRTGTFKKGSVAHLLLFPLLVFFWQSLACVFFNRLEEASFQAAQATRFARYGVNLGLVTKNKTGFKTLTIAKSGSRPVSLKKFSNSVF